MRTEQGKLYMLVAINRTSEFAFVELNEKAKRITGADFVTASNLARRLKTLKGLTPSEYVCIIWTKEPERFSVDPTHQFPGPNI